MPEIGLFEIRADYHAASEMRVLAEKIRAANGEEQDRFVRQAKLERTDLAGLPFLLGNACRLDAEASQVLATSAFALNELVDEFLPPSSSSGTSRSFRQVESNQADLAITRALSRSGKRDLTTLPAVEQILGPEWGVLRQHAIRAFQNTRDPKVAKYLVRRAVFETDSGVREKAVAALADQSPEDYTADLLNAFRHPWPATSRNAAEALVGLKRADLIERLEAVLQEPTPDSPVAVEKDGKTEFVVRELVRINHHKNCYLCHPPASRDEVRAAIRTRGRGTFPIGLVPIPGTRMRSSAGGFYYRGTENEEFVRADVTYLRQDFSVRLPVDNHGTWPEMQRFDFLVRSKMITVDEARERPTVPIADSASGKVIRVAIDNLRERRQEELVRSSRSANARDEIRRFNDLLNPRNDER